MKSSPNIGGALFKALSIGIFFPLAGSAVGADQLLLSDQFTGASNGAIILDYDLAGQKGTLTPLPYVINSHSRGDAPIATIHNPTAWDVVVRTHMLHGDHPGVLAFGYTHQFVDYSTLIVEVEMRRNNTVWTSVVLGNDQAVSQQGNNLFTLRLMESGAIQVKPQGSGAEHPGISFKEFTANGNDSFTGFRIEVENAKWDGTGEATVRVFYNVHPIDPSRWQPLDLGGPGGALIRPGFKSNFITFSSQHPGSNSTAFYRNIRIRTKDRN